MIHYSNSYKTLGFGISVQKLVKACTRAIYLGFEIYVEIFTVSVPQDKLKTYKICANCGKIKQHVVKTNSNLFWGHSYTYQNVLGVFQSFLK